MQILWIKMLRNQKYIQFIILLKGWQAWIQLACNHGVLWFTVIGWILDFWFLHGGERGGNREKLLLCVVTDWPAQQSSNKLSEETSWNISNTDISPTSFWEKEEGERERGWKKRETERERESEQVRGVIFPSSQITLTFSRCCLWNSAHLFISCVRAWARHVWFRNLPGQAPITEESQNAGAITHSMVLS